MANVFKIRGVVKNYEWGKLGQQSMVAILHSSANEDFKAENIPYAELWLGTHESGPATIPQLNNRKLVDWLAENKSALGDNISKEFGSSTGLPFLFKVLSVNKALSIQAHPNKQTAEKLHQRFPQHYPDANHKPELAVALTNFEALCGFRPLSELRTFLQEVEELQKVVGSKLSKTLFNSDDKEHVRAVFSSVMSLPPDVYLTQLSDITNKFKCNKYSNSLSLSIRNIFLKTSEQYPGDIGLFCFFFLNYINLKKGESVFLAANEPHAYLFGDCIECMACSDNVVRAGLTPKYRDVQTLCDILTYDCKSGDENIFVPVSDSNDSFVKTYAPPVKEFAIDSILLPKADTVYSLKPLQSASILLVVEGRGICQNDNEELNLELGSSVFISSNSCLQIKPSSELLMFRAYCMG